MVNVGRDDHPPAGGLRPYQLDGYFLALSDVLHLAGHEAFARVVHLGPNRITLALGNPFFTHVRIIPVASDWHHDQSFPWHTHESPEHPAHAFRPAHAP